MKKPVKKQASNRACRQELQRSSETSVKLWPHCVTSLKHCREKPYFQFDTVSMDDLSGVRSGDSDGYNSCLCRMSCHVACVHHSPSFEASGNPTVSNGDPVELNVQWTQRGSNCLFKNLSSRRMPSGMRRYVDLMRTDVSEERIAYYVLCYKWEGRGSIPDEVFGFFNWFNPSSRTIALGSTQPLTEMSTSNFPGGGG
jgi:hypothetical protein